MREMKLRQAIFNTDGSFQEWHYWGYFKDGISGWVSKMPLRADNVGDSQQCTGLEDKNGKEIYEGDIVRGMNIISYLNEDKIYSSGIVKYKHCGFVAVPFGMEEFNMVALGEWCEVIGNIYENPKLMELWSDK